LVKRKIGMGSLSLRAKKKSVRKEGGGKESHRKKEIKNMLLPPLTAS
jgi:hypothetical protein